MREPNCIDQKQGASERALAAFGQALATLQSQALGSIARAADLIRKADSRVIVTGMGKCSHVGRKIAATFQSTGQPASFLHPGEAAHGDMGMIESGNLILALSNSGQTDEVRAVASWAKDRSMPLVVMSSNPRSPLAMMADELILIPNGPEGCPINRAPMASALAMMAAGDAIAAELMAARQFGDADFLALHHGGYLGVSIRERIEK